MAADNAAPESDDTDPMSGVSDMSLVSVLLWQEHAFDKHAEDLVKNLLAQAHAG